MELIVPRRKGAGCFIFLIYLFVCFLCSYWVGLCLFGLFVCGECLSSRLCVGSSSSSCILFLLYLLAVFLFIFIYLFIFLKQ